MNRSTQDISSQTNSGEQRPISKAILGLFAVAILIPGILASATSPVQSIVDIKQRVQSGSARSADDLLKYFPHDMFAWPVIVPHSLSQHPSTPERPRMVMAKDDGTMFAAYSTDEKGKNYNQVEIAQLDPETQKLEIYLVDFNSSQIIQRNPVQCMGCHMSGGRVRLRVEDYARWVGWFGNTEKLPQSRFGSPLILASDMKDIELFRSKLGEIPRLRAHSPGEDFFANFEKRTEDAAVRLHSLIVSAESVSLFEEMRKYPDYLSVRYALVAASNYNEHYENSSYMRFLSDDLGSDFLAAKAALQAEIAMHQQKFAQMLNMQFQGVSGGQFESLDEVFWDKSAIILEWFLRRNGNSLRHYTTSGYKNAFATNTGVGSSIDAIKARVEEDVVAGHSFNIYGDRFLHKGPPMNIVVYDSAGGRFTGDELIGRILQQKKNSCEVRLGAVAAPE